MKNFLMFMCTIMLAVGLAAETPKEKSGDSPVPAGVVDPSTYVIGPADVIQISVWKEADLSTSLPVRPDGSISMPLLHDIPAAGLTPMQLGADISERLKKFVQDPQVTVVVTAVNSKRVFLVGEVAHPGPVNLTADMTMLQVLSSAGGLSQFANSKHIYILRNEQGVQRKIPFRYKDALKGVEGQNLILKAGDTIVVP
jgi:polysaccharide export outer membrane protein